jgi:signal transduction histidine kinase
MRLIDRQAVPDGSAPAYWERTRRVWHVVFYALLAVLTALELVSADGDPRGRLTTLGCLAVLAVAYATVGQRALGEDDLRRGLTYLVPAWAAVFVLVSQDPTAFVLLFVLFPQTWAMLPTGWPPVALTLVVSAGLGVLQWVQNGPGAQAATDAALTAVFNAGLSLLLGLWVSGIATESDARARLIDDLQRTRADLAQAERSRGMLAERERLARDIHDTLAQGFASILTLAQAAEATLDSDPAASRARLDLLARTARDNLAEARSLVAALAPAPLDGQALPAALARVVQRFSDETGVPVELAVTGTPHALEPNVEVVLLRSTQEALANVRKHASARSVRVELGFGPGAGTGAAGVRLRVEDDGVGISGDEGFGLRGMRDRVASVGGWVSVEPGATAGTQVTIDV